MAEQATTEQWSSRLGAVLAVAGSAIGLGNFLRFPGLAAQYGGGAFMIAYFCAFLLLGIPLSWVEWSIGRRGGVLGAHSCAGIFERLTRSRRWRYVGVFALLTPLSICMYYMYLQSWTLGYAYHTAMGHLELAHAADYEQFFADYVGAAADGSAWDVASTGILIFFALAFAFNLFLIYRGVSRGIERFCKISMPVLLVTSLVILVRVLTLGTPDPAHPERSINSGMASLFRAADQAWREVRAMMRNTSAVKATQASELTAPGSSCTRARTSGLMEKRVFLHSQATNTASRMLGEIQEMMKPRKRGMGKSAPKRSSRRPLGTPQ